MNGQDLCGTERIMDGFIEGVTVRLVDNPTNNSFSNCGLPYFDTAYSDRVINDSEEHNVSSFRVEAV
jgi:hypothetical protein